VEHLGDRAGDELALEEGFGELLAGLDLFADDGPEVAVILVGGQVAGFAEQELKEKINELTRYIEPAMIMLMGLLIGGVALALLLPIFTISKVVAS
jgi:type IV pilus assembly protein PilC